jgi:hypothetical protein
MKKEVGAGTGSGSISQRYGSRDPDPLVRGTDPGIRIRIRTKMSQIPNTGFNTVLVQDITPKFMSYCI